MLKTKSNQIMQDAYRQYLRSDCYDLNDAYARPSYAKEHAFKYCEELCEKYQGQDLRILGYNLFQFSCGFIGVVDGKKAFVYITKSYDRYCYLDELEG